MGKMAKLDMKVASWLARGLNYVRRYRGKSGRHRSLGLSTMQQIRVGR